MGAGSLCGRSGVLGAATGGRPSVVAGRALSTTRMQGAARASRRVTGSAGPPRWTAGVLGAATVHAGESQRGNVNLLEAEPVPIRPSSRPEV